MLVYSECVWFTSYLCLPWNLLISTEMSVWPAEFRASLLLPWRQHRWRYMDEEVTVLVTLERKDEMFLNLLKLKDTLLSFHSRNEKKAALVSARLCLCKYVMSLCLFVWCSRSRPLTELTVRRDLSGGQQYCRALLSECTALLNCSVLCNHDSSLSSLSLPAGLKPVRDEGASGVY